MPKYSQICLVVAPDCHARLLVHDGELYVVSAVLRSTFTTDRRG